LTVDAIISYKSYTTYKSYMPDISPNNLAHTDIIM